MAAISNDCSMLTISRYLVHDSRRFPISFPALTYRQRTPCLCITLHERSNSGRKPASEA